MIKTARYGLIALLLFMTAGHAAAKGKSLRFPETRITAQLHEDGSMTVTESRTYRFRGSFHYAYITFPPKEGLRYTDISISENGQRYQEIGSDKSSGTFRVTEEDDGLEVRWYFSARNTRRTFDLTYTVHGAMQRFEDGAFLQFELISRHWKLHHHQVDIRILPPEGKNALGVQAWIDGPIWGNPAIGPTGEIRISGAKLKRKTGLSLKALYAEGLFPAMPESGLKRRAAILAEQAHLEQRRQEKYEEAMARALRMAQRQQWGKWPLLGLVGIGLYLWWLLFKRYGRRPQCDPIHEPAYCPLPQSKPALASYLLNYKQVTPQALVSTLFDLADRHFLSLEETQNESAAKQRKKKPSAQWRIDRERVQAAGTALCEYECTLLDFLFTEITEGEDTLPLQRLKKKQTAMQKFFPQWSKQVTTEAEERGWYDKESSKGLNKGMGVAGILMLLTVPAGFYFGIYSLILMGGGILVLLMSLGIAHRTAEGERQYRYWRAYTKFLKKSIKDATLRSQGLSYIVQHMIYGPALGLQPNQIEKIAGWMDPERAEALMPWFKLPEGMSINETFVPIMAAVMVASTTTAGASAGVSSAGAGGAG